MDMINGCGTTLYGRTEVEIDGEQYYIATEFFCLLWVPLIPLASYLVVKEKGFDVIVWANKRYELIELQRLYRPHLHFLWWAAAITLLFLVIYLNS